MFSMNPGFYIGKLHIAWYGVLIAFGMLVAILLCIPDVKKRDIKMDEMIGLALWVIPFSIIGARLYYVIFYAHDYTFAEMFRIWDGGMAIYGGVIAGALTIIIWCVIKKKSIAGFMDVIAPSLIIAQSIGRWGNFINQEAYGYVVENPRLQWFPYAVYIEADASWHLATFFYESMWNLVGFAILMVILYFVKNKGSVVASYLVWEGIGRAMIEGLRTDSLYIGNSGIRVSQLLSIFMIIGGLVWIGFIIYKDIKQKKQNGGDNEARQRKKQTGK